MWDGDGGNNQWSNAANWVAGIVPVDGDVVLFPDGPAQRDVLCNLTPASRVFDSLRFGDCKEMVRSVASYFFGFGIWRLSAFALFVPGISLKLTPTRPPTL